MTSATRHFTSDNKSRSKKGFFFTWDYSSDGRSSPADTGDDDEAKAFVFQPGDAHVIGVANVVALSVAFWGESGLEIGLAHVGIVDTVPEISFLPEQTVEGGLQLQSLSGKAALGG